MDKKGWWRIIVRCSVHHKETTVWPEKNYCQSSWQQRISIRTSIHVAKNSEHLENELEKKEFKLCYNLNFYIFIYGWPQLLSFGVQHALRNYRSSIEGCITVYCPSFNDGELRYRGWGTAYWVMSGTKRNSQNWGLRLGVIAYVSRTN